MDLREIGIKTFDDWSTMWNRDLALTEKIMAPEFRLRYAQPGADAYDTVTRPHQLAEQIDALHDLRPGLHFNPEGELVVDLTLTGGAPTGLVASPYLATFTLNDKEHAVSGTDILRLENGLITEVWSVSGGPNGRTFYN